MGACPLCGAPLVFLGTLGWLDHYRCRDCGTDQSVDTRPGCLPSEFYEPGVSHEEYCAALVSFNVD